MLKRTIILTTWFCCLMVAKPVFSQCDVNINGIDSVSNNAFFNVLYNDDNGQMYMGGGFLKVNTLTVNSLIQWDGTNVSDLGAGTDGGGYIRTFMRYKNKLYMGGGFHMVDNQPGTEALAIWDGVNWSGCPIGEPLGGDVYDMAIYHDTLFICGGFWCIGNTSNIYRSVVGTDGTNWFNVGEIHYVWTSALTVFNDELYLGGYYGMQKYLGGTNWEQLPRGPTGRVNDMDVDTFNNFLYVGGSFLSVADTYYNGSFYEYSNEENSYSVAYYDGFEWHSTGEIISCDIYQQGLKFYHGAAYVGGCFDTLTNGLDVNYVARWNGTKWDSINCGLSSTVEAFEVFNDTLYIGGNFTTASGTPTDGIVKYFAPDTGCTYLQPLVQVYSDTFKINDQQPTTEVQFFNNNAYADSWQWDFDDSGATANSKDASHIFDTPGTYSVLVTVSHNACIKTATRDIVIIENTGEDELNRESLQFKLFPNPTSGAVSVECTLPQDKTGEIRTHLANGGYKNSYKLQSGFNHVDIPETDISKGLSMVSLFVEGEYVFSEKVVRE